METKLIYNKKDDKLLQKYPYYPCFFRTTCMLALPLLLATILSKAVYTGPVIKQGTITLMKNETYQAGTDYFWVNCLGYELDTAADTLLPCNCNYKKIFSDVKYCSSVYQNGESITYYEFPSDGLVSYDKDLYDQIMLQRLILDILFIYIPSVIISVSFVLCLFSKWIHGFFRENVYYQRFFFKELKVEEKEKQLETTENRV